MWVTQKKAIEAAKKHHLSEQYITYLEESRLQYAWHYTSLETYFHYYPEKNLDKALYEFEEIYPYIKEIKDQWTFNRLLLCSFLPNKKKINLLQKKPGETALCGALCNLYRLEAFMRCFKEEKEILIDLYFEHSEKALYFSFKEEQRVISFIKKNPEKKQRIFNFFVYCMQNEIEQLGIEIDTLLLNIITTYSIDEYQKVLTGNQELNEFCLAHSRIYKAIHEKYFKQKENTVYQEYTMDEKELFEKFPKDAECVYDIYKDNYRLCISKSEISHKLSITMTAFEKVHVNNGSIRSISSGKMRKYAVKIVIFLNDTIYLERNHQLIPISLKNISWIMHFYFSFQHVFETIFSSMEADNRFYKDIWNLLEDSCLLPLAFNDIKKYYNFEQYFRSVFKKAKDIPIKINRHNPNFVYMLLACKNKIIEKDYARLLQNNRKQEDLLMKEYYQGIVSYRTKNLISHFLYCFIKHQMSGVTDNCPVWLIEDYLNMSFEMKKKVKIFYQSQKKLEDEHDEIMIQHRNKHTQMIKIPKNSKFKQLRKLLPKEEFEQIKSRQRIVKEGVWQHNCVASYAERINKDQCAIYSYVNQGNGKRYTLEFRVSRNGKYFLHQAQCKYNQGCPKDIRKYIQSFL